MGNMKAKPYRVAELPIDYDAPPKINRKYRRFVVIGPPGCRPWFRPTRKPSDAQPNECYREMATDDAGAQEECRALNDAYAMGFVAGSNP
jgi:hypothetical protein